MAGNLSVAFTGDTTDLTAKAAVAKEQVRGYAAELRSAAAEAKASGASFNEQAAAIQGAAGKLAAARWAWAGPARERPAGGPYAASRRARTCCRRSPGWQDGQRLGRG